MKNAATHVMTTAGRQICTCIAGNQTLTFEEKQLLPELSAFPKPFHVDERSLCDLVRNLFIVEDSFSQLLPTLKDFRLKQKSNSSQSMTSCDTLCPLTAKPTNSGDYTIAVQSQM
jgi:hypothetical protein